MEINAIFQKQGTVKVGTSEPGQDINLVNPYGKPINISFDFKTGNVIMTIQSWDEDGRNNVIRDYTMPLNQIGWQRFLATSFATDIRPLAKSSFAEFDGLVDVGVEFIP